MKLHIRSKLTGALLSDGSLRFLSSPGYSPQWSINSKNLDIINHPVWTGKRPKEQTEIATFVERLHKAA
uniref:ribosomal protein L31 n=1 Tax=Halosiphon tomentosus TaxID=64927 RepID=UPI002E790E74|nr:ribosomal protein L31 [Halosiphon tomentosus]WBP70146.1 ribosomal protein L31 [Halosiphon tomentosus]